ncbi:hypothetical protein [Weissella cibaria]|nr:hypothetical protein [Weissella cibaria]
MTTRYPKLINLFALVAPVEYLHRQPVPANPTDVRQQLLQEGLIMVKVGK